MKLSKWLLGYDEKFWSILKDEYKRKDYLDQLYRFRTIRAILFFVYAIMAFVGIVFDKSSLMGLSIILFVAQGIVYLDTDSRISTIRLYELLIQK